MATKQPTKESAAEERHITLYTAIGNIERIGQTIHTCFEKTTKQIEQRGNALILILPDDTQVTFVIHHRQFNAEFLDKHIAGMMNFFSRVETDRTELQQNVLLQISLFNCVIGTAFTLDDNEDRTSYIVGTIQETAEQLNAFLLYEDMTLYTPKHRLLFSIGGDSEFTEYLPIANSDLRRVGRAEESAADRNRKERSTKQLRQEGVPVNEHLLCEVMESEARIRTPEETIRRAVTLFSLASYAHGMLAEKPDRNKELDTFNARDKQYDLRPFLTEKEKAYLDDPKPEQSANWPFEWRYEAAHPLFWATGIVDELRFPSEISDIQAMGDFLDKQRDMDELLSRIRMRSEAEILDAADLTLRYDWACVEARINNQDAPAELNGDIVMERHYAFNWLIGSNNGADWDDIHPHT